VSESALATRPGKLVTLEDVCRELGIGRAALRKRIQRAQFPRPLHGRGKTARWRLRDLYGEA